jgi:hypothetical protein
MKLGKWLPFFLLKLEKKNSRQPSANGNGSCQELFFQAPNKICKDCAPSRYSLGYKCAKSTLVVNLEKSGKLLIVLCDKYVVRDIHDKKVVT